MFDKLKAFLSERGRAQRSSNKIAVAQNTPTHIGIIMDGNGRWAQKRGLPRSVGHRQGGETLRKITYAASERGIKYLTVYAFSTENWKRSSEEVNAIMDIFLDFFSRYRQELADLNCRVRFMGAKENVPPQILESIKQAQDESAMRSGIQLIVAFNYGGRREVVDAVNTLIKKVRQGEFQAESINEDDFGQMLYLPDVPDPELIIRSSGELRFSNFLMWESAYSEFWVTSTLWPDFSAQELDEAIDNYRGRSRRFGGR